MTPELDKERKIKKARELLLRGRKLGVIAGEVSCSVMSLHRWLGDYISRLGGCKAIRKAYCHELLGVGRKLGFTFREIGEVDGVKEPAAHKWKTYDNATGIPVIIEMNVELLDSVNNLCGSPTPIGKYSLTKRNGNCILQGEKGTYEIVTGRLCGHVRLSEKPQ